MLLESEFAIGVGVMLGNLIPVLIDNQLSVLGLISGLLLRRDIR